MAALPDKRQPTVEAIFAAYEADQETGYRYHLGASLIGDNCERSLWYSHRWATRAKFIGRMLRLFQTGHLAEARFVADLRRVGVTVYEFDERGTGDYSQDIYIPPKQWNFRDELGHFGGSMDGAVIGIIGAEKTWHCAEFKTHSAKSFASLVKDGVQKSKPRHYAQMQVYMHLSGMTRAFYLAVNKDTDDLHSERIEYDATFAMQLMAKATRIVTAPEPPARISENAEWWECRFCDHKDACHGARMPERHCRSCLHSTPIEGGVWHCRPQDKALTGAEQEAGCPLHRYIPGLVHGVLTDTHDEGADGIAIVYRMKDGTEWVDGL